MENTGKSAKVPGIAIAAFVLGIGSILLPLALVLVPYLLYVSGLTIETKLISEALDRLYTPLLKGTPVLAVAAIVCGAIGLHKSRVMPRTSKKGVAFSVTGLVTGALMLFTAVLMIVLMIARGDAF